MGETYVWDATKKLSNLPAFPRNLFLEEGNLLYQEFLENRLRVVLSPAPDPKHADHKVRIAQSHNPEWYSPLYFSHSRRKRAFFEKALLRIINECDGDLDSIGSGHYIYDTCFRDMIYTRLVEGYTEKDSRIFPNNKVRNFFGLEPILEEDFISHQNYEDNLEKESELSPSELEIYTDKIPF